MKISTINNTSFKGHAAGKIKALYMQNPGNQRQLNIYNEMRKIGEKEGFEVYMHNGNELLNKPLTTSDIKGNFWGVWSQDNKIITTHESKKVLLTSKAQKQDEHIEASLFACNRNIEGYETEIIFDGGNIFLGKRSNGDKYLMTTAWTLYLSGAYQYLKSKNIENFGRHTFANFNSKGICYNKDGKIIATSEEYEKNCKHWEEIAKNAICEIFELKTENLIIIPDIEYHLDLVIRPLDYPYVLINSDKKVNETISKAKEKFKNDLFESTVIEDIEESIKIHRNNFAKSNEAIKKLKENGFIPIEIAMMYGRGSINFANAIVHQNKEGLIYITNSTKPGTKVLEFLQEEFEKDILSACPQIKKTYFVSGSAVGKDLNDISIYLKDYQGGIHCLCCEEIEE